jgi:hypothetical protein
VSSPSTSALSTLEATAPCRLEMIDGPLEGDALDGVLRLAVALDRRVFCRVEPRAEGLEIQSRDTGERVEARDAGEIADGPAARVARMLLAEGIRAGIRIATQVRVPEDAGLGTSGALQVALLAALGRGEVEILSRAGLASLPGEREIAASDRHAAVFGGVHALWMRSGTRSVERVATDPARVEECLLLVDPGPQEAFLAPPVGRPTAARRAVEALAAGAYDDVAAVLAEVHRPRFDAAPPAVKALAVAIERAGGAAWPSGRLVAVWAVPGARSPGPREAVASALKAAGVRSFPARVDVRGLEVE